MKTSALALVLAALAGTCFAGEPADDPAMLYRVEVRFGQQGLDGVALNGVDLRGPRLASGQEEGGGFFGSLTTAQWLALGFTTVVFVTVAYDAADEDGGGGTGGSGY